MVSCFLFTCRTSKSRRFRDFFLALLKTLKKVISTGSTFHECYNVHSSHGFCDLCSLYLPGHFFFCTCIWKLLINGTTFFPNFYAVPYWSSDNNFGSFMKSFRLFILVPASKHSHGMDVVHFSKPPCLNKDLLAKFSCWRTDKCKGPIPRLQLCLVHNMHQRRP